MKLFEFLYPKALFTILLDESVEQVENGLKYLAKEGRRDFLMMKYIGDFDTAKFELTRGLYADAFGRKELAYTFEGNLTCNEVSKGTIIPVVLTPSKVFVEIIPVLLFIGVFIITISLIMESYFFAFLPVIIPFIIYYRNRYVLKVNKVFLAQEFEQDLKLAIEKSSIELSNTKN